MDDKLTRKSQEALSVAIRKAAANGNPQVDPLHLLAALLEQADGTAAPLLRAVGADPALLAKEAGDQIGRLPRMHGATTSAPETSRQLLAVINTAASRARQLDDEYVSTEHLLVGIAADGGQAATVLRGAGATADTLTEAFTEVRGSAKVTSEDPEGTYQALEKYGVDLTQQARDGKLDPVIGRDSEIRRVVQVLSRRTKNNPVLIGEPDQQVLGRDVLVVHLPGPGHRGVDHRQHRPGHLGGAGGLPVDPGQAAQPGLGLLGHRGRVRAHRPQQRSGGAAVLRDQRDQQVERVNLWVAVRSRAPDRR